MNLNQILLIVPGLIKKIFSDFKNVEKHIINMIIAVFFIQLVDAAFFMLFNYYLRSLHYTDTDIATITAYRYVAIVLLAFPFGIYIKGRKILPLIRVSSIALPITSLFVLYAVENSIQWMIFFGMIVYGVLRLIIQASALPFIILNARKETHSESISLYFQTFSLSVFIAGVINYLLVSLSPEFFTEKRMLQIVSILALFSFYFVFKIDLSEKYTERVDLKSFLRSYDWRLIGNAVIPTILIAVGAGFTIPFINLFFQSVHGIESQSFSIIGSLSFLLVTFLLVFIPYIQKHYGYRMAIVMFQGLAVLALFIMASTEWYKDWVYAAPIAIIAYVFRQPLMNVAGPSTSELSLNYVGERNQEILSAIQAAIWSGSWFISSILFGWFRGLGISYVNIFMITVGMYIVATLWYLKLIAVYEKRNV